MHFQSTIFKILFILNLPKDDSSDELSDKEGRNEPVRDETAAATVLEGNKDTIAFKHYSFRQGELAKVRTW